MKPFDDSIPEEIETQHSDLVSMLRRASARPVQLTPDEQAQLIERASQRLFLNDQAVSSDEDQAAQPAGVADSIPLRKPIAHPFALRRGRRMAQFASMLAAVLVIAAIISASLLIFQRHQTNTIGSTPEPFHPPANMVTAHSSAGGFEMTLSLTPGPYFISELLAANISLTNSTQKTAYVGIPFVGSACGYATGVQVTGEGTPQFVIPIATDHSCPFNAGNTPVKPGQALTVVKYLSLTNSGHLTLMAETAFYYVGSSGTEPV